MYYDSDGQMRAAGAEAVLDEIRVQAEEEGWVEVEWCVRFSAPRTTMKFIHANRFKLRLRPQSMPTELRTRSLPDLPSGKSITDIYADFFAYLVDCATKFIMNAHPTLRSTWNSWRENCIFVLTHPNGWEGAQQQLMRRAAIQGGLVPDTPQGRSRIKFVSEGEASLHYCVRGDFIDGVRKHSLLRTTFVHINFFHSSLREHLLSLTWAGER